MTEWLLSLNVIGPDKFFMRSFVEPNLTSFIWPDVNVSVIYVTDERFQLGQATVDSCHVLWSLVQPECVCMAAFQPLFII